MASRSAWTRAGSTCALIALFCVSCRASQESREQQAKQLAETMLAQTAAALEAFTPPMPSPVPTQTHTPAPPTDTPLPTPTRTPSATPGPRAFADRFARDVGNWLDCEVCDWRDGALFMGPYPVSGAYLQHFTICRQCGWVTNYGVSVDATYVDGPSERGYGILLKLTDEYLTTLEITPWQTVDVWKLDLETGAWNWINGTFTGAVRTGRSTNHIQVDVRSSQLGRSDFSITINGRTILVAYNQPPDETPIGLTLFGHALEVQFENFEFEEYEPYGRPFEGDEPGLFIG